MGGNRPSNEDAPDGRYTFPDGDSPIMRDAKSTVERLYYTLKDAADGTSGEQADLRGGGLPQSGGVPPAILLASGWIISLSSLTCILLALRRAGTYGSRPRRACRRKRNRRGHYGYPLDAQPS